jgi:hypothetical protein
MADATEDSPRDADDREPGRRIEPDPGRCELCGFPLAVERHCKIVCPNCGYTRDCSDP